MMNDNSTSLPDFAENGTRQTAELYSAVSDRCRAAKYLLSALLVVFIIVVLIFFRDSLSPENIRYMLRQFDADSTVYSKGEGYREVGYTGSDGAACGDFRGCFIRADGSTLSVISSSGGDLLTAPLAYMSPALYSSDKWLLVCDIGGTEYSLFSTFSEEHSGTTEYPIYGASVSPDGFYAVTTRGNQYRGEVEVFNSSFELVATIRKDRMITGTALGEGGHSLAVISFLDSGSELVGEASFCDPLSDDTLVNVTLNGELPLLCSVCRGGYTVITDKSMRLFDKKGEERYRYDFIGAVPVRACLGKDYSAVCFASNIVGSRSEIVVFSGSVAPVSSDGSDPQLLLRTEVPGSVTDMALGEESGYLYLLENDRVLRLSLSASSSGPETAEAMTGGSYSSLGVNSYSRAAASERGSTSGDTLRLSSVTGTVFIPPDAFSAVTESPAAKSAAAKSAATE